MTHRLYDDLAEWWPLFSAPEDYAEEANAYMNALERAATRPIRSLLELGSGGGNNASFMKRHATMTLVDLSPHMLEVSQALNPECEHVQGDMRTVRLGRSFDAVFVHDAIEYMLTVDDLRAAIQTAWEHCRPGGAVLFCPESTKEEYAPSTQHGGHDGDGRAVRYLEWCWDPDPSDTTVLTDYVIVTRVGDEPANVVCDRHTTGLFSIRTWLGLMEDVGFVGSSRPGVPGHLQPMIIGVRPA